MQFLRAPRRSHALSLPLKIGCKLRGGEKSGAESGFLLLSRAVKINDFVLCYVFACHSCRRVVVVGRGGRDLMKLLREQVATSESLRILGCSEIFVYFEVFNIFRIMFTIAYL